jgi:hypothetical protein
MKKWHINCVIISGIILVTPKCHHKCHYKCHYKCHHKMEMNGK